MSWWRKIAVVGPEGRLSEVRRVQHHEMPEGGGLLSWWEPCRGPRTKTAKRIPTTLGWDGTDWEVRGIIGDFDAIIDHGGAEVLFHDGGLWECGADLDTPGKAKALLVILPADVREDEMAGLGWVKHPVM